MAWPFLEGVNADEVPEYYDVITDPMGESIHVCLRKWKKVYKILCLFLSDILYVYGQLIVALLFASAVLVPSGKETFHARLCFRLSCFLRFL